jgi:hypothetical protein
MKRLEIYSEERNEGRKMLQFTAKNMLYRVIAITVSSLLCICIFIPLFSALLVGGLLLITPRGVSYSRFAIYELVTQVASFGISGLLIAMVISLTSRNAKVITTLLATLLVTIAILVFFSNSVPLPSEAFKNNAHFLLLLGAILQLLFLWVCSFLGAWFMSRKNRKKTLSMPMEDKTKASTRTITKETTE